MFARTPRLTLRPGWAEDAPALARAVAHESVATKLSRLPWPYTEVDAAAWLTMERGPDDVFCLILAHEGGEQPRLVGAIGLHPAGEGAHEIGYWLTPDAWGRGYATEAGKAMLGIARYGLGVRHLVSGHFVDNPASGRVLRKLGFRPTGRIERRECRARGRRVPCATYTLDLAAEDERPAMCMAA
ncbi:GNAT family N-acetyltransferase [Sphingomonas sp. DT-204]|uniref:GNAT family N-acetyltransferase n=1 Tax=Sphingomonas sp. DT-204 TaxID=3396166 RepID=UPI003F1BD2CE